MKQENKDWWKQWGGIFWAHRTDILRATAVFLAMSETNHAGRKFGPALYSWMTNLVGTYFTQMVVASAVICVGIGAHFFKLKSQRWYGIVEVIFGVVSGFSIALTLTPTKPWLAQAATLVGCAYVIARRFQQRP